MSNINILYLKLRFMFSTEEKINKYFLYSISKHFKKQTLLNTYLNYKKNFPIFFNSNLNSILLEKSLLLKDKTLANHILDNENIQYQYSIYQKSYLLDKIITNNLYERNHLSWLAVVSISNITTLLKFEDYTPVSSNYNIAKKLISHPIFKTHFSNSDIQKSVLKEVNGESYSILSSIFLLLNKKESNFIKKTIKI